MAMCCMWQVCFNTREHNVSSRSSMVIPLTGTIANCASGSHTEQMAENKHTHEKRLSAPTLPWALFERQKVQRKGWDGIEEARHDALWLTGIFITAPGQCLPISLYLHRVMPIPSLACKNTVSPLERHISANIYSFVVNVQSFAFSRVWRAQSDHTYATK